jgi:hypothetical protein
MKRHMLAVLSALCAFASLPACSSDGERASAAQSAAVNANSATTGDPTERESFCPDALVSRKDMARFLERLKHGRNFIPPPARNTFSDVPPDTDEAAWIEQLAADGITKGVGDGKFAPEDSVPREQMAAFIVRLLHGGDFSRGGESRFTDVTNRDFIGAIEQLADDGITKGCTATEFCPRDMVPRDQMAAFLMRALHRGSPDPVSSGRFKDMPRDRALAGRVEQAVSEGIMEPCGTVVWQKPPQVGVAPIGFDVENPHPTLESIYGWLPTTPNYGLLVHARDKRYSNDWHRNNCGGDYTATMVLDIGEVTHDGLYIKGATFYTEGVSPTVHQDYIWVGTNGHFEKFKDYRTGLTDVGTPYISFPVNRFFPGGQGRNGDALQVWHTMIPETDTVALIEHIPDVTSGWKASISSALSDYPDGGNCAMILRVAYSTY